MEQKILTLSDYRQIITRRKWSLIAPFLAMMVFASFLALLLPSIFRSTATILIEQREIPAEYVTSSMTTYADQRIQSINQRILTSARLLELIQTFDLYSELKQKKTTDEIIEKMRKDIHLRPVNVEVTDRRSGRTATATIAFTLSFEGKDPSKVQRVTNTITSLFLSEDLKVREEQAVSTYDFLLQEKEAIQAQLAIAETKLAEFKKENVTSLPEIIQVNMQALDNIERNIERAKEDLRKGKEKKEALEAQLDNTSQYLDKRVFDPGAKEADERRLEMLKVELINLKTKFSDLYPDVVKMKQEIHALEQKVQANALKNEGVIQDENQKNPAYTTLSSRLAGLKSDIKSIENQIQDLENQARSYRQRLMATPGVEREYNSFLSERNNLIAKYNDLQAKMMEAKMAKALESKQKGERFTLVEAARFPEKPYKPNRLAIALIGVILGIGAGICLAVLREFTDDSCKDPEELIKMTGFPVLAQIPKIITQKEIRRASQKRMAALSTATVVLVTGLILFNNFVMDFDVLWSIMKRKLF